MDLEEKVKLIFKLSDEVMDEARAIENAPMSWIAKSMSFT